MLEFSFTLFRDIGLPAYNLINPGMLDLGDKLLLMSSGFVTQEITDFVTVSKDLTEVSTGGIPVPIPYRFDHRLFKYQDKISSLTTHVTVEPDGVTKIQNCWLETYDYLDDKLMLADAECISKPEINGWSNYVKARETKNFLPFVHNGKLLYVHSICPLVICELNEDRSSTLVVKHDYSLPIDAAYFGGNTAPIKLSETKYLIGFHYKQAHPEYGKWYYCNCFLVIDINTFKPLAYSDNYTDIETYWSLHEQKIDARSRLYSYDYFGVVFPCGIIDMGDVFRLSCGIFDAQGAFIDISKDSIKSNLKPIDN